MKKSDFLRPFCLIRVHVEDENQSTGGVFKHGFDKLPSVAVIPVDMDFDGDWDLPRWPRPKAI